jgi:hypothetical protein
MPDGMTRAVRDDLAKLAYVLADGLPKADAKALLGVFAREKDISDDMAWALFVRGKDLARREKGRAA